MQRETVMEQLKEYFSRDVLGGQDVELDEGTPLLEWGIINSFEMVRLLNFIQKQFNVDIPSEKMVADYFTNIATITDLIFAKPNN